MNIYIFNILYKYFTFFIDIDKFNFLIVIYIYKECFF